MKEKISLKEWKIFSMYTPDGPGCVDYGIIAAALQNSREYRMKDLMEVQEVLIHLGVIEDTLLEDGDSRYCSWIQEKDWVYRCCFTAKEGNGEKYLIFKGIDTAADIFLNGESLGICESAYLEYRFAVGKRLKTENILEIYVHSPEKMLKLYEENMNPEWRGEVNPLMLLRKGRDYGARFGFMPVGIFDEVLLEYLDEVGFHNVDYRVVWNTGLEEAEIRLSVKLTDDTIENVSILAEIEEEETGRRWKKNLSIEDCGESRGSIVIKDPLLWWPKNYGGHPMYQVRISLWKEGTMKDSFIQSTGLRSVRLIDAMRFEINGKEVRLWGAGITPIYGLSHSYYEKYAHDMLDKLDRCNMNAVRVWGPGKANPDMFYEELDRKGILVWQDFPTGTWQMPDDEKYTGIYRQEAAWMVRRLKHHPCILLWCGGNEHIYMCELDGIKGRRGFEMLHNGYREICSSLDPDRYYHVSCPYEGKYANDPSYGDSHGSRAYCAYTPGETYGIFFSEDIRVFPPQYKSAVRFMKEDIWEEGYVDTKPFGTEYAMPEGWKKHFSNNGHWKLGPVRQFYDAQNAEELIYKYASAAACDLYHIGADARTGNPEYAQLEKRKRTGHLFWKFNDTWPRFYCAFYDYYQECTLPYYAVKRVFAPLFLHIAVKDHLYLWGVNDTAQDRCARVTLRVFHMLKNQVIYEHDLPVAYPAGCSSAVCLDFLGPINWNCILHASYEDDKGESTSAEAFMTDENMLAFPDARLKIECQGNQITISTDHFARCVELKGVSEAGDEFGWYFEDNYFDLFPFETKIITVESRHLKGRIEGKAHYAKNKTEVLWKA